MPEPSIVKIRSRIFSGDISRDTIIGLNPCSQALQARYAVNQVLPLPGQPIATIKCPGAIPVGYALSIALNPVRIPGLPPITAERSLTAS